MDGVLFPTGTSLPSGFWNDTTTHSAGSQPQSEVSVLLSAECQDSAAQRHNVAVQDVVDTLSGHVPQRCSPTYHYHTAMYSPLITNLPSVAPQYSSLRSSAQTHSHTPTSRSLYMNDYSHQSQRVERHQEHHSSFTATPDPIYHETATQEHTPDYQESQYTYTTPNAGNYRPQIPRSFTWCQDKPHMYHEYSASQFSVQMQGESRFSESLGYSGGYFDHAHKESPYVSAELSPFYGSQETTLSQEPALTAYTTQADVLPSVIFNTSGSPRLSAQSMVHSHSSSPPLAYTLSPQSLQYPLTPELESGAQRYVRMQDVSPSPTISPDQVYCSLPPHSPLVEDPISQMDYVSSEASSSSADYDEGFLEIVPRVTSARRSSATDHPPRKRQRVSSDEDTASGESEREEEGDDVDDEEYTPEQDMSPVVRTRRTSSRRTAKLARRSQSPTDAQRIKVTAPVPVPNLTKKSRGRRVPTSAVVVSQNGVDKNIRSYRCKVAGCNKFFQRGEHLKRHVRSIHTNEKPHKCPYKKCGKDFSRHDNLRQHMRVHRNEPLDSDDTSS